MGVLRIMSSTTGDTAIVWGDTKVSDATELSESEVKEKFDQLIEKGFSAFELDSTKEGKRVKEFNPTAEEVVLVPHIQGG